MHNIPVKNKNSGKKKFQYILVSCNKIFRFAAKFKDFNAEWVSGLNWEKPLVGESHNHIPFLQTPKSLLKGKNVYTKRSKYVERDLVNKTNLGSNFQ